MATRVEIQHEIWNRRKQEPLEIAVLEILAAALRYVGVAIRQRGLDYSTVTIAADFEVALRDENLRKANRAYDLVAAEMRRLRAKAQRIRMPTKLQGKDFATLEASLGLEGVDYKQADKRRRQVLKEIDQLRIQAGLPPKYKKTEEKERVQPVSSSEACR